MSFIKINWNPADKDLRNFGRIAIIASLLVAILLYAIKGLTLKLCAIIIGVGFFIFLCSILSKNFTRWIYLGLTLVTLPIGMVVSFVLLAVFYYLLITPVGLIFRLTGRDILQRKFDASAESYWRPRRHAGNIKRYFNQF